MKALPYLSPERKMLYVSVPENDIEAHVRLLMALPVMVTAELIVHLRLRPKVKTFPSRRISRQQDGPRFLPPSTRRCACATRCQWNWYLRP